MHRNRKLAWAVAAILATVFPSAINGADMLDSFDLSWNTIDGGGGISSGGAFQLSGTIGQLDASSTVLSGGSYELRSGFWPGAGTPVSTCPSDIAPVGGDDLVNVQDMLSIINAWGACPIPPAICPADLSPTGGNGIVNVQDLLAVINSWGTCP